VRKGEFGSKWELRSNKWLPLKESEGDDTKRTEDTKVTSERTDNVKQHKNWTGWNENANANEGPEERVGERRNTQMETLKETEGEIEIKTNTDIEEVDLLQLCFGHEHKEFRENRSKTKTSILYNAPCTMRQEQTRPVNLIDLVGDQ
jgi:hypothetical protein